MGLNNYRQFVYSKTQTEENEKKTNKIDSLENLINVNHAVAFNAKLQAELAVAEAQQKFDSLERVKMKKKKNI